MSYEPYLINEEEELASSSATHVLLQRAANFGSTTLPAKPADWLSHVVGPDAEMCAPLILPATVSLPYGWGSLAESAVIGLFGTASTRALDEAIQKARAQILALDIDWDDAGGQRYEASTIDRAADLVKSLAAVVVTRGAEFPIPAITPADAGSIDLYWSDPKRTLLINVPPDAHAVATYSGRRSTADTTAGRIDLQQVRIAHLASWLSE